jgi:hypothetical protein
MRYRPETQAIVNLAVCCSRPSELRWLIYADMGKHPFKEPYGSPHVQTEEYEGLLNCTNMCAQHWKGKAKDNKLKQRIADIPYMGTTSALAHSIQIAGNTRQ